MLNIKTFAYGSCHSMLNLKMYSVNSPMDMVYSNGKKAKSNDKIHIPTNSDHYHNLTQIINNHLQQVIHQKYKDQRRVHTFYRVKEKLLPHTKF